MLGKIRLRLIVVCALSVCALAAVSYAAWSLAAHRRATPTVAVIPRTCGTWLWEAEHTGAARTASSLGLNVYWNAPMREDDVQGQIDILSKTVEHGAAGVILSPVEALPLRTPVRSALARGVPVVVVDTDLGLAPGSQLAYVLNDEQAGGRLAARRLGLLLKGHGDVAVLGIKKQLTSTTERARSLEATLAGEFPDIHVVFRSLARSTVSQEQQIAEKFLADGVHVDAIVALTEFSTRGAFYALTEAERVHQTPLIGFDQNILAPIRTGEIDSVVVQNTFAMGQIAMGLIDEALHGGMRHDRTTVQPLLATRENIDSEDMRKVLDLSWFQQ